MVFGEAESVWKPLVSGADQKNDRLHPSTAAVMR
jgi:hypothetical protein